MIANATNFGNKPETKSKIRSEQYYDGKIKIIPFIYFVIDIVHPYGTSNYI